jgi:hypothetical protein
MIAKPVSHFTTKIFWLFIISQDMAVQSVFLSLLVVMVTFAIVEPIRNIKGIVINSGIS